ncbi:sugar phosphate isomerase [Sphingobacterium cellulitidis]|uniref:sugar phosphate isomerase/epimerase family protein n=1 Tax=Sphingobacterium cellulitidis TaxID=1768011 RepID=UPI000B944B45|nr:sugar phosphate isomerase/epimerase family protein [Sphingobacterium cellulitidis]OYD44914.1 sugar phosphate isomerase [Sphingobacterium cellulitidis]
MQLPVKLGVSTWLWTSPFRTDDAANLFEKIASLGYEGVEIAVEDPTLIDSEKIYKELKKNGLQAIVCGAFGPSRDLTSDDEDLQKNGLLYIEDCLNISNDLSANFFAGPMYSAVGKARMVPDAQRRTEWNRAVDNLGKVCEMAASKGLELALEPLNRFESDLINNVDDVLRLIDELNHPAAKICLDMFHMNIEEPDPGLAIRKAGDKLLHVQVSENYRGTPGTGNASWGAFYEALLAINYKGAVSIESFTPENKELAGAVCIWRNLAEDQDTFAREGHEFLKRWAANQLD